MRWACGSGCVVRYCSLTADVIGSCFAPRWRGWNCRSLMQFIAETHFVDEHGSTNTNHAEPEPPKLRIPGIGPFDPTAEAVPYADVLGFDLLHRPRANWWWRVFFEWMTPRPRRAACFFDGGRRCFVLRSCRHLNLPVTGERIVPLLCASAGRQLETRISASGFAHRSCCAKT